MTGLKRGNVKLVAHQDEWDKNAEKTIVKLKHLLGNTAVDIQHMGARQFLQSMQNRLLILL